MGAGITPLLKKSQNRQTRLKKAHEWADEWQARHDELIEQLADAYNQKKHYRVQKIINKLMELNHNKVNALHNVINELDKPTRPLIDSDEQ